MLAQQTDLFGDEAVDDVLDLFADESIDSELDSEEYSSTNTTLFGDSDIADIEAEEFLKAWSDEELKSNNIRTRTIDNDIYFASKDVVSDYETLTKVEFKINSWEDILHTHDLKWALEKDYQIMQSMHQLRLHIQEALKAKYISVDTETTGLNIYCLSEKSPVKDRIVGMSLSWKVGQGIYIPFRHYKFKNLDLSAVLKLLKPLLTKKLCILHNAMFDYRVFYDLGIKLNVAHDTMSLLFHINSMVAKGGKALKENIKRIFKIDTLDLETMTGKSRYAAKFDRLDFDLCRVYGCADTDFALSLLIYLLPFLPKVSYAGYIQDMQMIPILAKMEYYGRKVDEEKLPRFNEINNADIKLLKDLIYQYVGTYINRKSGIDKVDWYLFNFNSPDDLNKVLYDILGMEPLAFSSKTGKPQTDKLAFKTFLKETTETVDPILAKLISADIASGYAELGKESGHNYGDDAVLINWKKISKCKYPVIFILKELRKRIKLKTSFFGKLSNPDYEGKYFTSVSLTAAETHRIIDPAQTIPAFLKELFIPFNSKQYLIDSDYAQVEARVFSSLAGMTSLIQRLTLTWADFHRESGSAIFGKKPEDINKEERDNLKVVNFGLPFKMGPKGLVGFKYGLVSDKELEEKYINEMKLLVAKWNEANRPVADMLNDFRANAVKICREPQVVAYFGNRKVGKIYNHAGRARVFDLEGVVDDAGNIIDNTKAEAIYRQAGNFPIQGYAAHLYREGVINLMNKLSADGLIDIKVADPEKPLGYRYENLVFLTATVHDESLLIIDERVNEYYMIQTIAEQCMLYKEGHAPYYMGISFARDWHEGHSGGTELSVDFVKHVIAREKASNTDNVIPVFRTWRGDPTESLKKQSDEFEERMMVSEFVKLNGNLDEKGGLVDVERVVKNFDNYTMKASAMKRKATDVMKKAISANYNAVDEDDMKATTSAVGGLIDVYLKYNPSAELHFTKSSDVIKCA